MVMHSIRLVRSGHLPSVLLKLKGKKVSEASFFGLFGRRNRRRYCLSPMFEAHSFSRIEYGGCYARRRLYTVGIRWLNDGQTSTELLIIFTSIVWLWSTFCFKLQDLNWDALIVSSDSSQSHLNTRTNLRIDNSFASLSKLENSRKDDFSSH